MLYVDEELTAQEKTSVEHFIAVNPDLKETLRILSATKIKDDISLSADFKASLVKSTYSEASLLMYIDAELEKEDQQVLEQLASTDTSLKKDLLRLENTRSTPDDSIVFPDKSILYKEEKSQIPFIHGTWYRYAAAAVLLLLLSVGGWWINDTNTYTVNKTEVPREKKQEAVTRMQSNPIANIADSAGSFPNTAITSKQVKLSVQPEKINKRILAKNDHVLTKANLQSINEMQPTELPKSAPGIEKTNRLAESVTVVSNSNTTAILIEEEKQIEPRKKSPETVAQFAATVYDASDVFEDDRNRQRGVFKGIIKQIKRNIERRAPIQSKDNQISFAFFNNR
ncbi:MAG: hypothetical protein ACO3BD_00235 [Chitinophagaceae bacterium]